MSIGQAGVVEAITVAARAACRAAVQKLAKVRQEVAKGWTVQRPEALADAIYADKVRRARGLTIGERIDTSFDSALD